MVNSAEQPEGQADAGQPPPPEQDIVTPHNVQASSNKGIDYDKLVGKDDFCSLFCQFSVT